VPFSLPILYARLSRTTVGHYETGDTEGQFEGRRYYEQSEKSEPIQSKSRPTESRWTEPRTAGRRTEPRPTASGRSVPRPAASGRPKAKSAARSARSESQQRVTSSILSRSLPPVQRRGLFVRIRASMFLVHQRRVPSKSILRNLQTHYKTFHSVKTRMR